MAFRQYFSPLTVFTIIKLLSAIKFSPGDPHRPTLIRREKRPFLCNDHPFTNIRGTHIYALMTFLTPL